MTKAALYDIWSNIRNIPGWLSGISEFLGLHQEDEDYLGQCEDAHRSWLRSLPKPQQYVLPEVNNAWAMERRREYLENRIADLKQQLITEKLYMARAISKKRSVEEAMCQDNIKTIEKKILKMASEIRHRFEQKNHEQIDRDMIERARSYDIRRLVDAEKDKVKCPFHDDTKPSMSVSKGFGYCFVCAKSVDSIGWLMHVQGLDFISAVKALQS